MGGPLSRGAQHSSVIDGLRDGRRDDMVMTINLSKEMLRGLVEGGRPLPLFGGRILAGGSLDRIGTITDL